MSIIKRKRGKRTTYEVVTYHATINGKKKTSSESFDKWSDAKAHADKQSNFKNNIRDTSVSDKVLFSEVAKKYFEHISQTLSDNTVISYESKYRTWIGPSLGLFAIGKISHLTVNRFFQIIREKKASPDTIWHVHVVLSEIFKFASSSLERYIDENPVRAIERSQKEVHPKSQEDYFTKDEVNLFLKSAKKTPYYNMFVFMLNTGLRIGEVSGIRKEDFNLDAGILQMKGQLKIYKPRAHEEVFNKTIYCMDVSKSKKARFVPLNDFTVKLIKEEIEKSKGQYLLFGPGKTEVKTIITKRGPKCLTVETKQITNRTVAYAIKSICNEAGIKYIGPHGLRHTFSASFLMNGGDIYTLSKLLGHKNVNTTIQSYGHLSHEFLKSAAKIVSFGE